MQETLAWKTTKGRLFPYQLQLIRPLGHISVSDRLPISQCDRGDQD